MDRIDRFFSTISWNEGGTAHRGSGWYPNRSIPDLWKTAVRMTDEIVEVRRAGSVTVSRDAAGRLFGRRGAVVLVLLLQSLAVSSLVMLDAAPASATTATPTAYVLNLANNTVTSIDTGTNAVGSTISAGSGPTEVAITPDGATAYVADGNGSTVTPIHLATGTAGQPIDLPAGSGPSCHRHHPERLDRPTSWTPTAGDLTPIDLSTNTTQPDIHLTGAGQLFKIAITPDGSTAYVTDSGAGQVLPVDLATRAPGPAIAVGQAPEGIAITPMARPPTLSIRGTAH